MYRDDDKNYLEHKSRYGGTTIRNGRVNNSDEYNHNYYLFNKEKWIGYAKKAAEKVRSLNQNSITKGTAKGSGGMPSNVRNKYTNTEIAKGKVKSVANAAGRRVNSAREQARLTLNNAGAAVERARQAAKGYGAKIRYKVGSAAKEAGRRLNNARYYANPNANKTTRGLNAAGMPTNVRARYTNTENLKRGAKNAINNAGKRVNAARDAAVDTFNDVRREAGRRLNNARYYVNPNANDVTRGRTAAGMPSNVRSRYTNTENLKRGAKDALNNAGRRVNDARDAAGRIIKEAGRRAGNAAYRLNPNGNDVTRGRTAAGMPSNVRSRYTNTENLKRGAKDAINAVGRRANEARDAAGRLLKEAGRQAGNAAYRLNPNGNDVTRGRTAAGMPSDVRARNTNTEKLKQFGNSIDRRVGQIPTNVKNKINDVKAQVAAGKSLSKIKDYYNVVSQLTDLGYMQGEIERMLGVKFTRENTTLKKKMNDGTEQPHASEFNPPKTLSKAGMPSNLNQQIEKAHEEDLRRKVSREGLYSWKGDYSTASTAGMPTNSHAYKEQRLMKGFKTILDNSPKGSGGAVGILSNIYDSGNFDKFLEKVGGFDTSKMSQKEKNRLYNRLAHEYAFYGATSLSSPTRR